MNAEEVAMPHIIHIQKTAPAPPKQIAVETPTMFPVLTRDAVETIRAWRKSVKLPLTFSPNSAILHP